MVLENAKNGLHRAVIYRFMLRRMLQIQLQTDNGKQEKKLVSREEKIDSEKCQM